MRISCQVMMLMIQEHTRLVDLLTPLLLIFTQLLVGLHYSLLPFTNLYNYSLLQVTMRQQTRLVGYEPQYEYVDVPAQVVHVYR